MNDSDDLTAPPSTLQVLWAGFLLFGLTAAAAYAGAMVSQPGSWYASLQPPPGTPPNWVFGPVWTTLYILMAIAACRAWYFGAAHGLITAPAMTLYVAQLGLNAAWSWLFFGYHQMGWALVDIVVLWVLILLTLLAFVRNAWSAGLLLLPYLCWVSYATYLNFGFWWLNPYS